MDPRSSKPNSRSTARKPADTGPTMNTRVSPYRLPAEPFLSPPQQPDEIGRLGPYRVLAELGRGGMGIVFHAEDPRLKRAVAIKVLLPGLAADPHAKARFIREAQTQAQVEHDNIIPIHGVEEANGVAYIVMPLLKGQTLAAALRQNARPPVSEVARIGREMALGLAAAHEAGLIHRDIKPGNIWLEGANRRVKILDFGLARPAESSPDAGEPMTTSGAVKGTPAYMSPEQARSQPVDHRTDLFSLGVVLYQMTTGKKPFAGPSAFDVMAAVVSHDPPPVQAVVPDVPPVLSALIGRLMAKNPTDRPASAEAVADELAVIDRGLITYPVQAIPLGTIADGPNPWADLESTQVEDENEEEAEEPAVVPRRKVKPAASERGKRMATPKWLWPTVAGLLGLMLLGGLVALATNALKTKPKPETVEQPQPAPTPGAKPKEKDTPTDPNRKAALALQPDAELTLKFASGNTITLPAGQPLPAEPFTITHVLYPFGPLFPPDYGTTVLIPAVVNLDSLVVIRDWAGRVKFTEADVVRLAGSPAAAKLETVEVSMPLTPGTLAALKRLPNLTGVRFAAESATDELLVQMRQSLPRLVRLSLQTLGQSGKVSNKGVTAVTELPVRALSLSSSPIVDRDLCRQLAAMPDLDNLNLYGSAVGNDALPEIAKMPKLFNLNLGRSNVSDAGLDHLKALSGLKSLDLKGTSVTNAGVEKLSAALPQCKITWDGGIIEARVPNRPAAGLEFDGKSTHVTVPTLAFDGKLPITLEAWISPETVLGVERHICILGEPGGGVGISSKGSFGAGFFDGTNWHDNYGPVLQTGQRVHVAAVITNTGISIFINGKDAGTKAVKLDNLPATKPPSLIGKHPPNTPEGYFHGTLHGLRISRSARYLESFTPAEKLTKEDDTLALYLFDEGTGTTLTDHSGNKHHGTIVGGKWVMPKKP